MGIESGWGFQRVDFEKGHMEFISDGFNGSYPIISTSFQNPRLKFTVSIDKGGWETEIEFEGRLNGDSLKALTIRWILLSLENELRAIEPY